MKYIYALSLFSLIFSTPGTSLAQTADSANLIVEPVAAEAVVTSFNPTVEPVLINEPILISANPTTVSKPVAGIANPALDVSYCGKKSIYKPGTYDTQSKPVIEPVCTVYDVRYTSYAPVDFGVTDRVNVYHFEVHGDGKIVFTDRMKNIDLENQVIKGETDIQYYVVTGGEKYEHISPISEDSVRSMFGDAYTDKVINFDDSIIYTYKIIK